MKKRSVGNWERLVKGALSSAELRTRRRRRGDDLGGGVVPPSLGQQSDIDIILRAAEEIQPDDPQVARILCEYAYSMAHNLDPQSEGRGVLQFKTGLMSVIRQKQSKRDGDKIDRSQDIQRVQEFYEYYRRKNQIDELEQRHRQGTSSYEEDPGELELRTQKLKKVYQISGVLNDVLDALTRDYSQEEKGRILQKDLKDRMETDALKNTDFKSYNILPLEAPGVADPIMSFDEVQAATVSLEHTRDMPRFPDDYHRPEQRAVDIFDLLEFTFGFQEGNVSNQREHLVLLLANSQSMLGLPTVRGLLDENAINRCYDRLLDNYVKWCEYLRIEPVTSKANTGQRRLTLMAMYLLIWGEAANLRFLPECLCYIFHQMVLELNGLMDGRDAQRARTYSLESEKDGKQYSFLEQVVSPIYQTVLAESKNNGGGKASHSAWRNYDDFNEYFWSLACFGLQWPWRLEAGYLVKPKKKGVVPDDGKLTLAPAEAVRKREKRIGKLTFVEHRIGFHAYHSFHRLWIFLTVMLQAMMVVAFSDGELNNRSFKKLLSVGPTYLIMKFVQALFDLLFIYGAYASTQGWTFSRIFTRLLYYGGLGAGITFLYVKMMREGSATAWYHLFLIVLGSYAGAQILVTILLRVPFFRRQADKCSNWGIMRFIFWVHQDRYFVGRGLYERTRDYTAYTLFWIVVLACKFAFSYHFQIASLVSPTQVIANLNRSELVYRWHDFASAGHHNALTIASIWAPVIMIYYLDIQVWYTVTSALVGGLLGATGRLGEIRTLSMLRKRFSTFPQENARILVPSRLQNQLFKSQSIAREKSLWSKAKTDAIKFAPMWNEIIKYLREEDYINNKEKELLLMPSNTGSSQIVEYPLFLLANKVYMAVEMAQDNKSTNQTQLWDRIVKDEYMSYAVQEAYDILYNVLKSLVKDEARTWVLTVFGDVKDGIQESMLVGHYHLKKVDIVLQRVTVLTGILICDGDEKHRAMAVKAMQDLYEAVMHDFLSVELREKFESWQQLTLAKVDGRLFANLNWPSSDREKAAVRRLNLLLTIKESSANIPKNLEARRRLQYFTNSLFMHMPAAPSVRKMLSFSVFTPYYAEDVMYSEEKLTTRNEDGITTLRYLQTISPDEWWNFKERVGLTENELKRQLDNESIDVIELRLWASYRGQTLARTVRGMMYYKKALVLASLLEGSGMEDVEEGFHSIEGAVESNAGFRKARALAELKFTYVVTCQIYGEQKLKKDVRAADISYLMRKYESLRVAYIDVVESLKGEKTLSTYYSKLVKADTDGNDQEIYSIKLPGEFRIGEGKPENQNHAIIFTRGDAVQTIDMNQDNYFEEAFKMRNLLEEFKATNCLRRPTILGIREHVFTGSVSSLAWFMSQQETSFVTLGQRVLARPLKVRMHYGHPDVFDRIFHITRGGISKASKTINISEDIFAGFNSTLRQGNVTHHEYIQVGKGRDVGLNQIALFEAKVSSGNGEQLLSRDVFRLGQLFDFFRMLSFFYTSVGYYITTLMTTLVVYLFLYGKCYLALSGLDHQLQEVADITGNAALNSALNTQFLLQIGVFTAVPMIVNFVLEQGVLKACVSFITMQLQLASVFFTFSLGTKTHYFGRTVLHGGAKYRATGRGFVVEHISFAENYRLYSRSHFTKAFEIAILLIVYLAYGEDNSGVTYVLLSFSSWFLALSWLFAPYLFNPSGFEWQKTVEDFDDWTNWLFYRGGIGVKGNESWESWWDEELEHIRSYRGKFWEVVLSLRFFFFQYGVVYSLHVSGSSTNLAIYGYSWLVLIGLILLFKVFTFTNQSSVNFQLLLRMFQGLLFLGVIAAIATVIATTSLTVGDCFAMLLAFIPTTWGLLSVCLALRKQLEWLRLWGIVRSGFRLFDAMMGALIFAPVAILSWFPFVSTFQSRILFNQAFSRGLEIGRILQGNRPNANV